MKIPTQTSVQPSQREKTLGELQTGSLSVYIARVIKVADDFESTGKLIVDINDLSSTDTSGPLPDENGSTYDYCTASLTLRMAYIAWNKPPEIKYKGRLYGKGSINIEQATSDIGMINITLATSVINSPAGPCTGVLTETTGKLILKDFKTTSAEVDISTEDLEIMLTSDEKSQLPWCVNHKQDNFIVPGMKVLCIAIANSLDNLYAVDILK